MGLLKNVRNAIALGRDTVTDGAGGMDLAGAVADHGELESPRSLPSEVRPTGVSTARSSPRWLSAPTPTARRSHAASTRTTLRTSLSARGRSCRPDGLQGLACRTPVTTAPLAQGTSCSRTSSSAERPPISTQPASRGPRMDARAAALADLDRAAEAVRQQHERRRRSASSSAMPIPTGKTRARTTPARSSIQAHAPMRSWSGRAARSAPRPPPASRARPDSYAGPPLRAAGARTTCRPRSAPAPRRRAGRAPRRACAARRAARRSRRVGVTREVELDRRGEDADLDRARHRPRTRSR